jgi:hypothetical protein
MFKVISISALLIVAICASKETFEVCDFGRAEILGKIVTVRARIQFSRHGMAILANSCREKVGAASLMLPGFKDSPEVRFTLEKDGLDKLRPFFHPNGGVATGCATMTGQIFYKSDFENHAVGGGMVGNGFGANGLMRAAFVVKSVEGIQPCE